MNDFDRVARVIRYIGEHYDEQPDLDRLAAVAGLSRFHFHRLFAEWAGVTPKNFIQCLTAEHARALLRDGASVLHAALASGLSGPGRLHDLLVSLDAASPGEIKNGGAGLEIAFGFAGSPFGDCLVAQTARGVCHLSFVEKKNERHAAELLRADWPKASLDRRDEDAVSVSERAFRKCDRSRPLRAWVKGTAFQLRVWRELLNVPEGSLVSYGELAQIVGRPGASRAVGQAVGANHIAYLIPCHRVIRETGAIGGYRWDPVRKRALLAWERCRQIATSAAG